jgi:hypothetical protein
MDEKKNRYEVILRYSHLLLLLQRLYLKKLITTEEAVAIKEKIMKKYNIISDYST